jgi:tetratricopeptide (TPR) repeat protein
LIASSASSRKRRPRLPTTRGAQPTCEPTRSCCLRAPPLRPPAERRARLAKHPYVARASRFNELLTKAKINVAKGEWGQAYGDLNLASQIDERNEEVKKLLLEVRKKNDQARAVAEFKKGQLLEETNTRAALEAYRAAATIDPQNAVANLHTARLLEEHGGDLKETSAFAQRAVDCDPKSADARFLLARLMDTAGLKQLAKKHFDEGVRLAPAHPEAKKQSKRRWPF